ncbi:MAG: hypothetical protein JXE06_10070, partial [Coriobacteriia bacterium]|nr:hypothetical protein [Coriobacteriia bacterium]
AVRGGGRNIMAHLEDLDGDGVLDLMLYFETQALDPTELQDGYAVLTGSTVEGADFLGLDEITLLTRAAPARGRGR